MVLKLVASLFVCFVEKKLPRLSGTYRGIVLPRHATDVPKEPDTPWNLMTPARRSAP
jgi:hypothetical protein